MNRYLTPLFIPLLLMAGCATQPAQVQYKTQVVDTSCTKFSIIKIPADDLPKISDTLKQRILAHDLAWQSSCGTAQSPIK